MCIFIASFSPHLFVSAYQTDWGTVTSAAPQQHMRTDITFQKKKWYFCPILGFLKNKANLDNTDWQVLQKVQPNTWQSDGLYIYFLTLKRHAQKW